MRAITKTGWLLLVLSGISHGMADEPLCAVPILEDNGAELLPKLTNPTGDPGEGYVDEKVMFSGKSSVRIVPMQRFNNFIPGWDYRIREKPRPGEYRYLRFAWKAPGLSGVMLQLHDTDWHLRYTAGADKYGWGTKYVAEKPPAEWKLVTVDLWKDFGDRDLHGIALTCFDGEAAWFDHIYFGRSMAELDAIDATGLCRDAELELDAEALERHWSGLSSADDALAYNSFWTLVAGRKAASDFLTKKLGGGEVLVDEAQIKRWIRDLDDDKFDLRDAAMRGLEKNLAEASRLIEEALKGRPSAESRFRLEKLQEITARPATAEEQSRLKVEAILRQIALRRKQRE